MRAFPLLLLGSSWPKSNQQNWATSVVVASLPLVENQVLNNHDEHDHDHDDHFCGTRSPTHTEKAAMEASFAEWQEHQHAIGRSLRDSNYTIPVQFVVMEAADGRGNLTDAQLDELLLAVNTGFQPTPFQFEHIGTQRTQNDTLFRCDPDFEYEWKAAYRVGQKETLNVFICNLFAQGRFGIYGVGDFPGENFTVTDAVILMNPVLPKEGVTFGYMEGVFTHEVVSAKVSSSHFAPSHLDLLSGPLVRFKHVSFVHRWCLTVFTL